MIIGAMKIKIHHLPMLNLQQFWSPCICKNDTLFLSILELTWIFEHFDPKKSTKTFFFLSTIDDLSKVQVHGNMYTYPICE